MFEQIKSLYGQAFVSVPRKNQDPDTYYWFKNDKGITFGLKKSAVTDKEYQLLSLAFIPIDLPQRLVTDEEKNWSAFLFNGATNALQLSIEDPRYLLHIYFRNSFKETEAFKEAILALFDEAPVVLWQNNQTALLILKTRPTLTKIEEITQLLATDFYLDASLFIGSALNNAVMAKETFELEEKAFTLVRRVFPEKHSFIFEKVVPLLLLSIVPDDLLKPSFSSLLTIMENEDPEWTKSLFAFFENGMNITAASKSLFIHRNSLQYRLERFTEKTGLDPKQFKDALFIYLALLTKKLN